MILMVFSGHGCFGKYLHQIARREVTPVCHEYGVPVDTALTVAECTAWDSQRRTLSAVIGRDLSLPSVVRAMLEGEREWKATVSFCEERASLLLCAAAGVVVSGSGGWLPRAVQLRRGLFLNDVRDLAPIDIKASLRPGADGASEGAWDFTSVSRLLALLGASERAAPVRRALRRRLRLSPHTRRFISGRQSWKMFPSLGQDHPNEMYYDLEPASEEVSGEEAGAGGGVGGDGGGVLVLENPVEARLPGAQISVKLLRDILEARALAARNMPSTARSTFAWIALNKTSATGAEQAGNVTSNGQTDSTTTNVDGNTTDGGSSATEAGSNATEEGSATEGAGGNTNAVPEAEGGTTAVPAEPNTDQTAPAEGGESNTDETPPVARAKRGSDHLENSQV